MYYYIFDPPRGPKEYERTAQIKQYVSQLGIAGEMVQPQPGRSVTQLVESAISKRYSTVIAVGGMQLINQIAEAMSPHDAVLGIIPLVEHPDIAGLIGVTEWKSAADQLKRRRWGVCRFGRLANGAAFLTPARIDLGASHRVTVRTPKMLLYAQGGSLTVTPCQDGEQASLLLELQEALPERKRWWQVGRSEVRAAYTKIPLKEFDLACDVALDVTVAGSMVSGVPTRFKAEERTLKLIAARTD